MILGLVDRHEVVVALGGPLLTRLGSQAQDWVGRPMTEFVDVEEVADLVRQGLAGVTATTQIRMRGRTWLVSVAPHLEPDGTPGGAVALLAFADQVQIATSLSDREFEVSVFEALVASSADFISMADAASGEVLYLNPAGAEMVGLGDGSDLGDLRISQFLPPARPDLGTAIRASVSATGRWSGASELVHFETGERIPVSTNVFVVRGREGSDDVVLATVQRDERDRVASDRAMAQRVLEQRMAADLARKALTLPVPELLEEAVDLIAVRFTDMRCAVLRPMADGSTMQAVASSAPGTGPVLLKRLPGTFVARAMDEGEIQVSEDLLHDPAFTNRANAEQLGIRGTIGCPIPGRKACGASSDPSPAGRSGGPVTTSPSWSRWPRRSGPPYAARSWSRSCSTRPCTTR